MKTLSFSILLTLNILLSASQCQQEDVKADTIIVEKCDPGWNDPNLALLKTIKNEEGAIVMYEREYRGDTTRWYHIQYADVPTAHLAICNLPKQFMQEGLKVRFSAKVYAPDNLENANYNALPSELTSIENISKE